MAGNSNEGANHYSVPSPRHKLVYINYQMSIKVGILKIAVCDLYQAECQVSIHSKIIKLLQKLTVLRHFQSLSGKNRKVEKLDVNYNFVQFFSTIKTAYF